MHRQYEKCERYSIISRHLSGTYERLFKGPLQMSKQAHAQTHTHTQAHI